MSPIDCQKMLEGFEHDLSSAPEYKDLVKSSQHDRYAPLVHKLFCDGEYIAFTIRSDAATTPEAKFMVDTRAASAPNEWWGVHTDAVVDVHNTTMIFMGQAKNFTGMHGDWADAVNIAFAVQAKGKNKWVCSMPLARWVFLHPGRLAAAQEWVKANVHMDGLTRSEGSDRFKLSMDQINSLQRHLGKDNEGASFVQVKYQHHGERMYVP
ncbi:TPA: hypothetical protein ACH3X2_009052, partial [Trebouxia sp. C0005]